MLQTDVYEVFEAFFIKKKLEVSLELSDIENNQAFVYFLLNTKFSAWLCWNVATLVISVQTAKKNF